jgi:hypothetical protein
MSQEKILNQCRDCGFEIELDPRFDDMNRDQCFDCSGRQLDYENDRD